MGRRRGRLKGRLCQGLEGRFDGSDATLGRERLRVCVKLVIIVCGALSKWTDVI